MKKPVLLVFICLIFIIGCSKSAKIVTLPNGDIQESTESISDLPEFLDDKDENMRTIYLAAAQNQELLEYIPCYCGCGESAGHNSNLHCFIGESTDEAVTWDDHSTRCGVCLETAAESIIMQNDGKSVGEIRDYIDEKYKDGYAKPTPTPEVNS